MVPHNWSKQTNAHGASSTRLSPTVRVAEGKSTGDERILRRRQFLSGLGGAITATANFCKPQNVLEGGERFVAALNMTGSILLRT